MAQTNISIRMDEDLKRQFDAFCSEIGMSMTTAFCVFAKTAVREQKIPFEIKADAPNAMTIAAMDDAVNGKDLYGPFDSVKQAMEALNA